MEVQANIQVSGVMTAKEYDDLMKAFSAVYLMFLIGNKLEEISTLMAFKDTLVLSAQEFTHV